MVYYALGPGTRISSTNIWTFSGGGLLNELAILATVKFIIAPTAPIPSGEMPSHQFSTELSSG